MACSRLAFSLALFACAACPAEDGPDGPVGSDGSGSSGDASTGDDEGSASQSVPITAGDCPGVGLGCGANECCEGLVCEAGVCDDPSCASSGEACEGDDDCCGGVCRSDGVCGPQDCIPEGGACEGDCCDDLPCDDNTHQCSSTCATFEEPCDEDEDCCERACVDGSCGGLG